MNPDSLSPARKLDLIILGKALKRAPEPENLFLSLTDLCDLKCLHCHYRERERARVMPFETAKKTLFQAAENGIPKITFFGGEPSLYPRLDELIKTASSLSLFTELDTNGQSPDLKKVEKFASLGLSSVMVSLHSENPREHDRLTGKKGSHGKVLDFIKNSIKAGLICYVSVCFLESGYDRKTLEKFTRFSRKLGVHGIRSVFFYHKDTDLAFPPWMAADIEALELGDYVRSCFSLDPGKSLCAAKLNKILYIGTNGEARICPYSKLIIGDLGKEPLSSIIARARKSPDSPFLPCAF